MYKTANGVDVCGYDNIDDWKKVLVVDLEVGHERDQLKNEQERSANLLQQKDLLQSEVDHYSSSQKILVEHENKLTQDLIDLDKKYQDERVKPRWGSPIAWTLAAVSTSILAGFVIYGLVH